MIKMMIRDLQTSEKCLAINKSETRRRKTVALKVKSDWHISQQIVQILLANPSFSQLFSQSRRECPVESE